MLRLIIGILLLPFNIIYYIFGLITGKDNYYIIARNTTNGYNILKSQNNNDIFNERDIFFLSGVANAYKYVLNREVSLDEIYSIAQANDNLEDFLFDFIKVLLIVDTGYDAVNRGYASLENRNKFKKSIANGINNSKKYDDNYAVLIDQVLKSENVMSYVDTDLYDELDNIIK